MSFMSSIFKKASFTAVALAISTSVAAACPFWNNPVVFGTGTFDSGALPNPM